MPSSHYAILGVPRTFTEDQLKRQYRLLALKYHPDRNRGNEEAAAEKFKEIQAAWSTLSNPEERPAYDAELREREPVRPPRHRPSAQAPVRPGTSRDSGGAYSGYDQRSSGQRGATDGDRGGQRQGQGSQSGFEASWREKQRAAAQREERRNQCQAAKVRAEAAYWREFATDGQWTQPQRQPAERQAARAPVPDGMPPGVPPGVPPPGESAHEPYPRSRATAAPPARGPQFSSEEFDRFAAASARRAPPADPAPPQAEWDGMEAALAASAAESAVARLLAERQEAQAQAQAVAEGEESVAREEAEIEEAVWRVEQHMEEERRAVEAQLFAAITDEQLIAGMTAEEEWAPEPWSAAAPRTPMGGSSAGSAAAAPDRAELAERQLAALMEMGYHAAQVANYCDGETPLELLIEQLAASDAPPSGEAREAAEASPPSTPRLSSVRRLGAAAQKVWKAKTSSRPASARQPGRSF